MKYTFATLLSLVLFAFSCFENDNPLDENGINYTPPEIIINENSSSIRNRDTTHVDSIFVALAGNREESRFNLKIDDGAWAQKWEQEGTFGFGGLADGGHTLYIKTMYLGGERVETDSITFYVLTKGYKPGFKRRDDTTIAAFEGKTVAFVDHAEGVSPIVYSWYKGTSVLEGKNDDTLKFIPFSANDTGSYRCIALNEYGNATGRTFILKNRPFTGAIKGVVVDSSGNKLRNATVTLLPTDKEETTDSTGSFTFSSLSANTCSLKISLPEYHDTTLSGIVVNDSETIVLPAITLKMIAAATFMVTYNKNGADSGTVPVDENNYYKGKEVTIAGNPGSLHKEGYSFSGWNTKEDGSGKAYKTGDRFVMGAVDIDLYAQWTKAQYTVTYHGNGNTGGTEPLPTKHLNEEKVVVSSFGTLEKTGHSFYCWNTDSTGSGLDYNPADQITINSTNINLYARWAKNKYKIVYMGNGNDDGTAPVTMEYLYMDMVTVADRNTLVKTGYSFNGWSRLKNGSDAIIAPGSRYPMGVLNDTLYAQWTINKYTVIFNTMGGEPLTPSQVNYGDTVQIPAKPEKRSYVFSYWCNDVECKNQWNFSTEKIYNIDTLYAKWVIMDVDGNLYTEVKIGDQIWMVENLKTTKYRDSSWITLVEDNSTWEGLTSPGYCWYDNDSGSNFNDYGTIYNWYVVNPNNEKKVAPSGWHIPTDTEWDVLINHIGGSGIAGGELKETGTEHWKSPNESSTNRYGFSARAGGIRSGSFYEKREYAYWWTATEYDSSCSWMRNIGFGGAGVGHNFISKSTGIYIRCIRDW